MEKNNSKILLVIVFCIFNLHFQQKKLFTDPELFNTRINIKNPDYKLLDEALFQATNQIRRQYHLQEFKMNEVLQQSAIIHADQMLKHNFYSHNNPFTPQYQNIKARMKAISGKEFPFKSLAENIAQYDLLDGPSTYYIRNDPKLGYVFLDLDYKTRLPLFTYNGLAKKVVAGWMSSPGHRENILNPKYKYLGTSASISIWKKTDNRPPFARLVQNFGS